MKKRPSSARRGYGYHHRKIRLRVLRRDRKCRIRGCTRRATNAAHITDLRDGGKTTVNNMRGLCQSHHSKETRRHAKARKRR